MNKQLRYFLSGAMAVALFAASAVAQDATSAAKKAAADQAAKSEAPAPVISTKPDPAVDTIVESNPKTPGALLQAASILTDLDRVDLAKKYLRSSWWRRSRTRRRWLKRRCKLSREFYCGWPTMQICSRRGDNCRVPCWRRRDIWRDPARLNAAVDQLGDPSRSVRRTAVKRILAAHEDAVPALVTALGDANNAAAQPLIRETLVSIGAEAVPPLVVALANGNNAIKVQVIGVLAQIGSRDAVAYLAVPATAEGVSPDVREAARRR